LNLRISGTIEEVYMAFWNQPEQEEQKEILRVQPPLNGHATPASIPAPILWESEQKDRRESIFGPGVTIEGKIEGDADLRIAGKFKGEIQTKGDLNIEKGAHLTANVNAVTVSIAGEIEGNIVASSQVRLLESGQLMGDLKATTLTVAAGARMRGHVDFGWNPSEMAKFNNGHAQESHETKTAG
jgi:cytoskeletal protein CcmA (bactofilin family)